MIGEKQGASARSSWRVPSLMRAVRVRGKHFNGRQPSGLNNQYFDCRINLLLGGGGLMHGIKIPQQDFALKMQGGLMRKGGGGGICGTLWYKFIGLVIVL